MKKIVLALASFCGAYSTLAGADCDRMQLGVEENLSSYLKEYAGSCLDGIREQRLASYELPSDRITPPTVAHYLRMKPAWDDIATSFSKLQQDAPTGSQMQQIFAALSARAAATSQELLPVLQGASIPERSLLRLEGWKINPRLTLLGTQTSTGIVVPNLDVKAALDQDCQRGAEPGCVEAIKQGRELMSEWYLAERLSENVSSAVIFSIRDSVVKKDELWNAYVYDSKPMLPLDFVLTDLVTGRWRESDQFPTGFREPPNTQWFLLHPTAGVEYSSDALDGEQMKPILFVEIAGANRWNPEHRWINAPVLRYLSGAAVVVSYADRDNVKDTGYGVMLTFNNVYSLGAARYGDSTGIFLSLDFANLVRDKYKPRYERFKDRFERFNGKLP